MLSFVKRVVLVKTIAVSNFSGILIFKFCNEILRFCNDLTTELHVFATIK